MNNTLIQITEIPENVEYNSVFEIISNKVNYYTHGFFKYPCKFIPHIPRWAILKYTKRGQLILDPFAGSGTTLVEAILYGRNALGVDFDKLSQLLCRAKTTTLSEKQIKYLKNNKPKLFARKAIKNPFKPDLHNINHWFPSNNIIQLSYLKEAIDDIYKHTQDEKIHNFLLVCFASIIKKCSYADDTSPKPYVSTRIKKIPLDVQETFLKVMNTYLKAISEYLGENSEVKFGKASLIAEDARDINIPEYINRVNLAVTSPPYINAFDYVRSLRLENAWLGYYGDKNIIEIKRKQVGTEFISSSVYSKTIEKTGNLKLDTILKNIYEQDKKRAHVVMKFFEDMDKNFAEVNRLLKNDAHYVVVIGDSRIRGVTVPTHEILIDVAKRRGFRLENIFSYIIKNRYLRIPRSGRGGLIKKDWVIDLVKKSD